METGQANVFGDDLEPATVMLSDVMEDNFRFRRDNNQPHSHPH
jgi:hypothetical protein